MTMGRSVEEVGEEEDMAERDTVDDGWRCLIFF